MVRSVRSRAVAISAGRTSAARSVWWATSSRCTGTATRRSAPVARASIGTVWPGSGGALPFFLVALAANDDATPADRRAIYARDDPSGIAVRYLHQCVTLAQVDLSDVVAGNPTLTCDRAHEIADLHAIARPDCHEKARHPSSPGV